MTSIPEPPESARTDPPARRNLRRKLDPRLKFLLSLDPPESRVRKNLEALKDREDAKLQDLQKDFKALLPRMRASRNEADFEAFLVELRKLFARRFAPLTTGVYLGDRFKGGYARLLSKEETVFSGLILTDMSAADLDNMGVIVRCQAGDIFTAFIPESVLPALEASTAVRYIELASPLLPSLDWTRNFTKLNTFQAVPSVNRGKDVIIGVIDDYIDFYHPDFQEQTAGTPWESRILFLWDQRLIPAAGESSPPTGTTLPGFFPMGGAAYGVEYSDTDIEDNGLNRAGGSAYQHVRHGPPTGVGHGTLVTGCAAGNGQASGAPPTLQGAAPEADIIFVGFQGAAGTDLLSDNTAMLDGCAYIFARASLLGRPCVVNISQNDNQGPHDGTSLGEQFLDYLLLTPGRVITVSAGNSNNLGKHASGSVSDPATAAVVVDYLYSPTYNDDDIEIWYHGPDRFTVKIDVEYPAGTTTTVLTVPSGGGDSVLVHPGVNVSVVSVVNDPRNGDNVIKVFITLTPPVKCFALKDHEKWTITLVPESFLNGSFEAWIDRNNEGNAQWVSPEENTLTIGPPATANRVISVGSHTRQDPPTIVNDSGCGPTRELGTRIKPEITTVGAIDSALVTDKVHAPAAHNENTRSTDTAATRMDLTGNLSDLYSFSGGTSISAPIVAGACALLFKCCGSTSTWADIKQVLLDAAGTAGAGPLPSNTFGFGYLQMPEACPPPVGSVDVWSKDTPMDMGPEPCTEEVYWISPDIELRDATTNALLDNPTYDPANPRNTLVWVYVRNRGTRTARNTEAYLYWADPATNIPFPEAWNRDGIYTVARGAPVEGNRIVIPDIPGGGFVQVAFHWSPPAPGSNLRGDDHFCLLVRLENESDPSLIGTGGPTAIPTRNNLAQRNLYVLSLGGAAAATMSFNVEGTIDGDSLVVIPDVEEGHLELDLPIQSLPWRDKAIIEGNQGRRPPYSSFVFPHLDPLVDAPLTTLVGPEVQMRTGVQGAKKLTLRHGIATIFAGQGRRIIVPEIRIHPGTRMPAAVRVRNPGLQGGVGFVHVGQLSGGRRIGGVSLKLKP